MKEFFIIIAFFIFFYLMIAYIAKVPSECTFTRDPLLCKQIVKAVQNDR